MVGLAEWTDEKEILFPEMTALIIGLLIIDKRVWNVKRWQIILLMTLGAAVGICIVRYSPLPYVVNLCAAFAFAGASLLISRATLIPLISACVLPVFASYGKYRLSDSSLFNVSVSSACTNHPTPTHDDLCRNGKLQSRIQKSPYTSISLSDYRSHSGYCTSNCRSPPSSSTGKYRYFNHCSYPVPHLRVDREILCPFRSIGIHSYAITPRGAGLVTFGGFYRSRRIHNHRHGCLSKML